MSAIRAAHLLRTTCDWHMEVVCQAQDVTWSHNHVVMHEVMRLEIMQQRDLTHAQCCQEPVIAT